MIDVFSLDIERGVRFRVTGVTFGVTTRKTVEFLKKFRLCKANL